MQDQSGKMLIEVKVLLHQQVAMLTLSSILSEGNVNSLFMLYIQNKRLKHMDLIFNLHILVSQNELRTIKNFKLLFVA